MESKNKYRNNLRTKIINLVEDEAHFETQKWSWNEETYGRGSRPDPKPRMTMLAKASRKLLLYSALSLSLSLSALQAAPPLVWKNVP
jgi:hypothetical protein